MQSLEDGLDTDKGRDPVDPRNPFFDRSNEEEYEAHSRSLNDVYDSRLKKAHNALTSDNALIVSGTGAIATGIETVADPEEFSQAAQYAAETVPGNYFVGIEKVAGAIAIVWAGYNIADRGAEKYGVKDGVMNGVAGVKSRLSDGEEEYRTIDAGVDVVDDVTYVQNWLQEHSDTELAGFGEPEKRDGDIVLPIEGEFDPDTYQAAIKDYYGGEYDLERRDTDDRHTFQVLRAPDDELHSYDELRASDIGIFDRIASSDLFERILDHEEISTAEDGGRHIPVRVTSLDMQVDDAFHIGQIQPGEGSPALGTILRYHQLKHRNTA